MAFDWFWKAMGASQTRNQSAAALVQEVRRSTPSSRFDDAASPSGHAS